VNDVSNLAAMVNGIRQYGFEVDKVLDRLMDLNSLIAQHKFYQEIIQDLETKISSLKLQHSLLEFQGISALGKGMKMYLHQQNKENVIQQTSLQYAALIGQQVQRGAFASAGVRPSDLFLPAPYSC
jgi:hypothetical protein